MSLPSNTALFRSSLGLLSLLGSALIVHADDAAIEARLKALEAELSTLRQENATLRRDLGVDGKVGLTDVKPLGKEPVLSLGGLVQAQGDFGDKGDSRGNVNDRIRLRRVRLGASGRFLEEFDFKVEGEYVGTSTTLTDAYINFSHFSWANLKVGQFKTPFGYEFIVADPKLYTIERTLGTDRLTLNRQVGVQAAGDFFDKQLSYTVGVFNGNGLNTTTNDNNKYLYIGRLAGTPWQGKLLSKSSKWTVGVDGFTSADTSLTMPADFGFTSNLFTGDRRGKGLDSQFNLGPFDLWGEYLRETFQPVAGKPTANFNSDAWYVQATYFLVEKEYQVALKYDEFDPNKSKLGDAVGTVTFGFNWFIKGDDLKIQLNYLLSDMPAPTATQRQLQVRTQLIF